MLLAARAMIFREMSIPGVFVIEPERHEDGRGFFARMYCQREFARQGLATQLVQCSVSFNAARGTLRGMHYQVAPSTEAKLVRCTRGSIYDVVLDLRATSATFRRWAAAELTPSNHRMLYVPHGVAHGFQTLDPESEVFYQMSDFHIPDAARGVRWNDPAFAIEWPEEVSAISERDRDYPDFAG
jgi:dTDP-4-dehydrorhamnose 3,5-epimerase